MVTLKMHHNKPHKTYVTCNKAMIHGRIHSNIILHGAEMNRGNTQTPQRSLRKLSPPPGGRRFSSVGVSLLHSDCSHCSSQLRLAASKSIP